MVAPAEIQTVPDWESIPVEELVGKAITIKPQKLLNQGRLRTTQDWIDRKKLRYALDKKSYPEGQDIKAWISEKEVKGKPVKILTVGDGNHRTGLACIKREEVPVSIIGLWEGKEKSFGFNLIIQKLQNEVGMDYDQSWE